MKSRAHYVALAVVWLFIFAYGIYFSALSMQRHRAFLTNASDLGQIDQAIWNSSQGRFLEFTRRTGEQSIRLTDHVEPLFVLIAPIFFLYDNVEALLILQSFVIALGALAVFWIANEKFRHVEWNSTAQQSVEKIKATNQIEFAAVLFAAMYLLFPALQASNLAEFHAVTFVPSLVLFAYHYGLQKKWERFALFAILLLLVKEEIALLVLMLAGYFVISDFRFQISDLKTFPARFFAYLKTAPRVPLVFVFLSLLWFVLTFFVIIPQFNTAGRSPYTCRYVVSEDCREVVRGLFLQERLGYLFQLFASSGFVSLLDPISLLLGSPLILANVISNYPAQYSGTFHYSAPVVPYFILAAIGGSVWLARVIERKREREIESDSLHRSIAPSLPLSITSSLYLPIIVFLIAFVYHLLAGSTPIARAYSFPQISLRNQLFEKFAAQIPRDANVSTTPSLHPHLSHREFLYRYPVVNDADYVMLDVNESDRGIPSEFRVRYNEILREGFGVVDAADGYVLLQRGAPQQELPDEFFTPFRAQDASPQYPAQIDFDNKIRFLGYDVLTDQYGRAYLQTYWQRLQNLDANYYLFPFLADENGAPIADLNFPMTVLFWYPSASWKENEIIVGKTLPLEWGARARIGVGVVNGFDWNDTATRLRVTRVEPSNLNVVDETWVELGEFVREGKGYEKK